MLLKQLEADQQHLTEVEMSRAKVEEHTLTIKDKIKSAATSAELEGILPYRTRIRWGR